MKKKPRGWNIKTAKNGVNTIAWGWKAAPIYEGDVIGEVALGGFGYPSSEEAYKVGRQILMKCGLLTDEDAAGRARCQPED